MMRFPEPSRLPDNLEIPGLYPPKRRLPNWPVWLWLIVVLVAAIPAVGIPGVVLAHYTTSNSNFCLTCHGTGETPDRSVPSDVHPSFDQVSCVDCHAKPGQIVFEGYVQGFQAEPERVSSNCMRCHPNMAEKTDTQGFKFNTLGIIINHSAHLQRGATCVTCHSNVAHDLSEPKTNRPRMEACLTCHSGNTSSSTSSASGSCTTCHGKNIPAPAPSRELVGRKPVVPEPPAAPPVTQSAGQPAGETQPASSAPQSAPASAGQPATQPAAAPAAAKPADDSASIGEGKGLFAKSCTTCHGQDGGAMPTAKLNSKSWLQAYGVDALVATTTSGKGGMPPFGGQLTEQQIRAIVSYLFSAAN